ncbi:MAG: hypothetical protein Q9213_005654 [Squamulea squamosa]
MADPTAAVLNHVTGTGKDANTGLGANDVIHTSTAEETSGKEKDLPAAQESMIVVRSKYFAYYFYGNDVLRSNYLRDASYFDHDLKEYKRYWHDYRSLEELKVLLGERAVLFRDDGNMNVVGTNNMWQNTVCNIIRKVNHLYDDLATLKTLVQKEWMAQ